jgi:hypothetical protein
VAVGFVDGGSFLRGHGSRNYPRHRG